MFVLSSLYQKPPQTFVNSQSIPIFSLLFPNKIIYFLYYKKKKNQTLSFLDRFSSLLLQDPRPNGSGFFLYYQLKYDFYLLLLQSYIGFYFCFMYSFLQKVVLKVLTMTDDKTKQKAIEAAADIFGDYYYYYHFFFFNYFQSKLDSGFLIWY